MQGRNLVVEIIAPFVKAATIEREGVLDEIGVNARNACRASCGFALFEQVEEASGVSVCVADQGVSC